MNSRPQVLINSDVDVIALVRHFGIDVVETFPVPNGQGRTRFLRTASNENLFVKWSDDPLFIGWTPRACHYAEALLTRGYPVPKIVAHGLVDSTYVVIEDRIAGDPPIDSLEHAQLTQLLEIVELQADAPTEFRTDREELFVTDVVMNDHAGWWARAKTRSIEAAQLVSQTREWIADAGDAPPRYDFVHLDLNFSNILLNDGRVSGIVDLDYIGIGDRVVDLACLAFEYVRLDIENATNNARPFVELLHERAVAISGEAGWRQGIGYHAAAWLGWQAADGFEIDLELAITCVERITQT